MRKILYALTFVAIIVLAGCEDTPADPEGEAIVGSWKASKTGLAFGGASDLEIEFKSAGAFTMETGGVTTAGTYSTSGSSGSSGIRDITMTMPGMQLEGIYQISGSNLKLEVVSNPPPSGVVGPDAITGIGSTTVAGAKTNAYVTEMQKQ